MFIFWYKEIKFIKNSLKILLKKHMKNEVKKSKQKTIPNIYKKKFIKT